MSAKNLAVSIVVFLLIINGVPTMMEASGLSAAMGIDPNLGINEKMSDVVTHAQNGFSPNTGVVESFVSLSVAAVSTVEVFFQSLTAAPTLFKNLGAPWWLVDPPFAAMYVISVMAMIYVATGRRFG